MKRILFISIILTLLSTFGLYATLVLDPSGAGGFELGSSFADNGWTAVNSATTEWTFGTAQFTAGSNGAYITEGGSYTYSAFSQKVHLYHSVTIPEGETMATVSFKWKNTGEGPSNDWDNLKVFLAPSTYTIPAAGTEISSTYRIGANWYNLQSSWQQASILLNPLTAGTYKLIFTWKTDGSNSYPPPAAIDEVSIVTSAPPSPLTGIKTIGTGGDYTTFTSAINDLNVAGIGEGGVTFNVSAGSVFIEDLPLITATGTSANPIIFQKSGAGDNPVVKPTSATAGISIKGGDYFTFDGIDVMSLSATPRYGYSIEGLNATNGSQNNTIKNCKVTLNRENLYSTGIYQNYGTTTPTSVSGANSNNTYQNITIENAQNGFRLYGNSSTYPDLANKVIGCTIGGSAAGNMGGAGSNTSQTYGIWVYSQSGVQISGNIIRNFTQSSSYSVYGIYMTSSYGANRIFNNKIYGLAQTNNSSSNYVYGISLALGTGTHSVDVYNNMIWDITSNYSSSGSSNYLVRGIYLASSASGNTFNVDYNSVRISGPLTSNSAGVYFNAATAVNKLRNNVIVNETPNQSSSYYHNCVYFSATTFGATGSVSNNNVLYVPNAANGNVVRVSTTGNYANIPAWTAAASPANTDNASRPTDPRIDPANPLNILTGSPTPVEGRAQVLAGISTDIYGTTRHATAPDIGAHEGAFTQEVECQTPTAQPTNLVLIPNPTSINGSFNAAAANAYLVVGHSSSTLTFSPVDGTYYSVAQSVNTNEVILSASSATSFTATGLSAETPYYCTVFAFNNTGIGAPKYYRVSPLYGTQTTLPAAPAVPGTLTATAFSATQIDLTTTANAAGSNIMIARNTVNTFGTPLATGYTVNAPITGGGTVIYMGPAGTFNDTPLLGGTLYYYSAWSYITAERTTYYAFSTTAKTANATTPQTPATLPYTEGFEVWPHDWSVLNGTQTNKWYVGNLTVFQGAQAAYISGDGGVTNQYVHTTSVSHMYRDITFTAGATEYEFSFRYNCAGESTFDGFQVFLTDLTTYPVAGTQLTAGQIGNTWYNLSSGWVLAKVTLPGTLAGTTKRLVISWRNDSGGGVQSPAAVDNVTITAFMTPQPTALTASAIGLNSATLSWTSTATSFDLEWGSLGFNQGSGTLLNSIPNNYSLGSLSAQTGYSYYVRANAGGNLSAWAGPFSFYTAFTIPIVENLDAVTTPNLPNGWSKAITSTATSCVVDTRTTAPNSAPNHVYMYHSSSNAGADVRLVSPPFTNSVNTLYTRFFAKATATGKVLQVGTVNSQSVDAVFNLVSSIPLTTTYTPYIVDFAAASAGQYIAYRIDTAAATFSTIYLDDININTSPYNELALTSFTVTPLYKFTAAEVTFSMTVKNNGTNSAGKNVVLKQGENVLTTIPVGNLAVGETANLTYVWTPTTAGTFNFTAELPVDVDITNNNASLTNQTIYTSGQLAEGFEGLTWPPTRWEQWQGVTENAWAQTTASNYDGTKAAGVILTTTNSSSYIATPRLSFTPTDNTVSFYARSTGTNQKVQCWYGESTDGTSYTAIGEPIAITGTYTQYTISAPELAGLNKRIAFQADPSGNAGTIYIDNIVGPIIYIPAEAPGPVALVLPTNNEPAFDPETGSLSWTPPSSGGDAVGYYVRLSQNPDAFDEESNASFDGTVYDVAATAEPTQTFLVYTEQLLSYNNDWYWQVIPYDGEFQTPRAGDCEHRMFHTIDQITAPGTLALGNIFPNASRTGSIIVTNVGPTPLSFTVTGSPEFVFAVPPYSVPANNTYELGYTFTAPATTGAYTGSIQINETLGGLVQIPIAVTATVSSEISLGTGTSTSLYMPVYAYYNFSTSQVIYPADWLDVPAGQRIEKLYYQYSSATAPANTQDFKIWMGYTDQLVFPSTINSSTWLPIAPMTLVFDGIWNISAGAGWKEIILQTPFTYDPANGNLVVVVDENTPDGAASGTSFYSTATTGVYHGISCYDDGTNFDPADPAATPQGDFTSYTARAGYPNTKFVFGEIPTQPVAGINPESWNAGVTYLGEAKTQEFTIRNNGVGTLTVYAISTPAGSPFSVINPPALPANLTNTDTPITFTVEYRPTAESTNDQAEITIDTNEAADPTVTVTGSCLDPTIYAANLPFTEDFDGVTAPTLSEGWTKQVYSITPSSYNVTASTTYYNSSPNSIRFYSYNTTDDLILISPLVEPDINTLRIKFRARYSTTATSLIVGTMDGPGTRAVFTPYQTIPISSTTFSLYSVDFADYEGSDQYIAFKLQVGASNATRYIYLDDVTFEEPQSVPPLAATPTFPPNAAVTLKNPLVKWTLSDAGEPVEYTKVFMNTTGVFNLDLDTDVVYNGTATQFQTVTPDDATQYFWKVVNYNVYGGTAGPTWSFTTPGQYDLAEGFEGSFPPAGWLRTTTSTSYWGRSTTSPYEAAAGMYAYSSTSVVYTISTPKVTVDAASTLDFYAKVTDASQVLQILQSTDRQNWTQVGTNITLAGIDTWYPISVNLGLPTGDYYLAFSSPMQTIGSKYIYIDHVIGPEISPVLPDAVTQNTPVVDAVDQFNLPTFSWTAAATGGIPESYKIYVGLSNTFTEADLKATVTSSPYRLTSPLAYATPYYWQVVAHNRAGDSINNGVRSFTTMANPTINVLPMEVDFTTFPPAAWYLGTGLLANPNSPTYSETYWVQDDWLNITSPVNKAAKMNIYSTNRSGWLITPPINIPSIGHRLELDIGLTDFASTAQADSPTDDRFIILIGDGSTWAPANILREWNNTGSPYVYDTIPNTGTHVIIPLDSYTGTYQIAFYGESIASGGDNDFFVDNVKVWLPPANDLAATQISGPFQGVVNTQFSYQVTVANMGTAAQNAYTVELHSVETRALLTSINVTDALAPTETAVHTLNWTPTTVADYNIYAKVVLTGDADTTNNQTANKAVGVYNPLSMPINETWDAFAGNHWTNTADGHWSVVSSGGNPGKAMKFSYSPTVTDYTSALNSFVIDASAATGVRFKYDYYLSNDDTATIEGMRVEVYNGTAWIEIDNVTNQGGSIPWTTKTWDISSLVAGQMFKVRFITYGANSYNINYWYFDNIRFDLIPTLTQPADLVVTQTGTNVNLDWTSNGAEGYKVYQSDDPYTWTGEGTLVTTNTFSIPVGANTKKFYKVTSYYNSGAIPAPPTKQYRYNGAELIEPVRAALFGEFEPRK